MPAIKGRALLITIKRRDHEAAQMCYNLKEELPEVRTSVMGQRGTEGERSLPHPPDREEVPGSVHNIFIRRSTLERKIIKYNNPKVTRIIVEDFMSKRINENRAQNLLCHRKGDKFSKDKLLQELQ